MQCCQVPAMNFIEAATNFIVNKHLLAYLESYLGSQGADNGRERQSFEAFT